MDKPKICIAFPVPNCEDFLSRSNIDYLTKRRTDFGDSQAKMSLLLISQVLGEING
jgi:hypothetical protein